MTKEEAKKALTKIQSLFDVLDMAGVMEDKEIEMFYDQCLIIQKFINERG